MFHRILVVERDKMIRALLHELLESEGYVPITAHRCQVLNDVRDHPPAAILIDPFGSAGDSGWEVLRLLRSAPETASIPIIVCTADAMRLRDMPEDDLTLANRIILKPFDLDELLDALGTVTRRRSLPPPCHHWSDSRAHRPADGPR